MTIRYGISPIAWMNDDMPELCVEATLRDVLEDISSLGFVGVELGGKFPQDAAELNTLLSAYRLRLAGGWYSASLLTRSAEEEIAALQPRMALLKALKCDVFVIAETSNAIHCKREMPLKNRPHLQDAQWRVFGQRLSDVADYLAGQGLKLAYHHHLGTVVQSDADLQAFLASTRDTVGLTLDTGHAYLGGIDPIAVIEAFPQRIKHVHCKDFRRAVFDRTAGDRTSFLDGVLAGMFTVPGDGEIDYARFMTALYAAHYSGWIVVEAEQDPFKADPHQYSALGLRTLRQEAKAAGFVEEAAA